MKCSQVYIICNINRQGIYAYINTSISVTLNYMETHKSDSISKEKYMCKCTVSHVQNLCQSVYAYIDKNYTHIVCRYDR